MIRPFGPGKPGRGGAAIRVGDARHYKVLARQVVEKLSAKDLRALGSANTVKLHRTLGALLRESDRAGLQYVPVFGYLSLITTNAAELGKTSQKKVVQGVDVLKAELPGYSVSPVASTVFRGTPTRPGLVAGISPSKLGKTPGVVLAVPRDRVVDLLPKILQRELAAENDLKSQQGVTPLMYAPRVLPVKLQSGRTVKSLVFTSDPNSPKTLATQGIFKDSDNVTGEPSPGALAWMMTSRGGVRLGNEVRGGKTTDYWQSYVSLMTSQGLKFEPWIAKALEGAGEPVSLETLHRLEAEAKTNPVAAGQLAAMAERYAGAASPIEYRQQQRPDGPARVSTAKKT